MHPPAQEDPPARRHLGRRERFLDYESAHVPPARDEGPQSAGCLYGAALGFVGLVLCGGLLGDRVSLSLAAKLPLTAAATILSLLLLRSLNRVPARSAGIILLFLCFLLGTMLFIWWR